MFGRKSGAERLAGEYKEWIVQEPTYGIPVEAVAREFFYRNERRLSDKGRTELREAGTRAVTSALAVGQPLPDYGSLEVQGMVELAYPFADAYRAITEFGSGLSSPGGSDHAGT